MNNWPLDQNSGLSLNKPVKNYANNNSEAICVRNVWWNGIKGPSMPAKRFVYTSYRLPKLTFISQSHTESMRLTISWTPLISLPWIIRETQNYWIQESVCNQLNCNKAWITNIKIVSNTYDVVIEYARFTCMNLNTAFHLYVFFIRTYTHGKF